MDLEVILKLVGKLLEPIQIEELKIEEQSKLMLNV